MGSRKAALKPNRVVQGIKAQPLMNIQWVSREKLRANLYNPNTMAPPERNLLKISIMEDGWTQPIVARKSGEIVDGFHRWSTSADPEVAAMTEGKVPVVYLDDDVSPDHQMMSTIRHNRARGQHGVLRMAEITEALKKQGLSEEEISRRLQMEDEEVERLLDRAGMTRNVGETKGEFNKGWTPGGK